METPLEDAVLASIKSTFTVEGQTFDTKEKAKKHLEKEQKIKNYQKRSHKKIRKICCDDSHWNIYNPKSKKIPSTFLIFNLSRILLKLL